MNIDKKSVNSTGDEKLIKLEEEISRHISDLTSANKRLKRKIFDLYTIFEISRHLNSVLDTESLLDGIILTVIGQMGVSGCAIFTVDSAGTELKLAKSKGITIDHSLKYSLPIESPIIKMLSKAQNTTHRISELSRKLTRAKADLALLKSVDTELVIPMSLKNRICGLLIVTEKISRTPFYEDDKDFLSILANQLSVAVENARLFESEKQAYNQLAHTQRQLVETEKLAALGQLSARVAHEVNNPLGIIKNYLELITQSGKGGGKIPEYVTILKEEVDRIARIVRQLLDFYHPHSIEKGQVRLPDVVDEIIVLMSMQMDDKRLKLVKKYDENLPPVWASSEQMKQVFLNLIMNAGDAMHNGGEIVISGSVENDHVILEFADSGPGIDEEHLTRVFEPFYTTKENGSGTGLGLSVCYGIIQNHGGTISVKNRKVGGAAFTIELPVHHE